MYQVGVIGCGRISSVYREAFLKMKDRIRVRVAIDKDIERAKKFAAEFPGCEYSDHMEDLLEKPLDSVHILTPHFLHKKHAIACLEAGFHVLSEKPIAILVKDGEEMIETARRCGRQLGIVSQNRYIPGIQKARSMLKNGKLGKIIGVYSTLNWWRPPSYYECDWKGKWETEGGGVVIDQAIHSLDLVRYLMDCPVKAVKGHIDKRVLTSIEVEDVADAAIFYENGAVHSFYACNYYSSNASVQIEFMCERGRFTFVDNDAVIFHMTDGSEWRIDQKTEAAAVGESYWGKSHWIQIRDFYDCLEARQPVPVQPEDALKTLELVQAIYQSSREGRKIIM